MSKAILEQNNNEIVLFETKDNEVTLSVSVGSDTVWLSANQMAILFERDEKTIRKHINNVFNENELDKDNNTQKMRVDGVKQKVPFYTLDVIISVGYRVKSQRGTEFRKWANSVLKQYIMKGYAINEKRLAALNKTVEIQSKIIANTLEIEETEVLRAVKLYTDALVLLDQYDHQSLSKPKGKKPVYRITYDDCRNMINHMEDSFSSDVFGVEKEAGKVEGILAAVYQDVFGGEVYPSLEEKAANLLYFMIKDHPFADGCKRIAASLFLEFLDKNDALIRDGQKVISDGALVAITLMIAESNPEEKDIMTTLVMNLLKM
ncbi:Fic/DOC family protein [Pseudobutyrivibrio sp. OR37]|uniref:RhuM family protein n=1 Tax=Pseudobutyrivibrio sp. OR37 TaxID=1798186 RepID=UPI0008EE602F|nr:RhuM family protein [Pseudobutyrivibrio sp. OR37]SFI27474.1 Fic/DOC family protein [Pseudobutyrivibrio sp. OR37]